MDFMIHTRSFRKGIQAIDKPLHFFKPEYWSFISRKNSYHLIHIWTPVWHKGRGPYIVISLSRFSILRGY